jgi:hypothetical protein
MTWETVKPGEGVPVHDNAPETFTAALYADMKQVLANGLTGDKTPTVGERTDGAKLFYPETVNVLVGASEAGKTFLALCVMADELFKGKSALVIDVDHNGAKATAKRLRGFGVSEDVLTDVTKFRYASPESKEEFLEVIAQTSLWKPSFVLVDSIGEVMALFGANSNDPDQYRQVHRAALTPPSTHGACVLAIDHEPKSESTAQRGASGTVAKRQAVDGALFRVTAIQAFTPGKGGKAKMTILKDRHGAIREASPTTGREPTAAVFHLIEGEATDWKFYPPDDMETLSSKQDAQATQDANAMLSWDPAPSTVRDAMSRLGCAYDRAKRALAKFADIQKPGSVPVSLL